MFGNVLHRKKIQPFFLRWACAATKSAESARWHPFGTECNVANANSPTATFLFCRLFVHNFVFFLRLAIVEKVRCAFDSLLRSYHRCRHRHRCHHSDARWIHNTCAIGALCTCVYVPFSDYKLKPLHAKHFWIAINISLTGNSGARMHGRQRTHTICRMRNKSTTNKCIYFVCMKHESAKE